MGEIEQNARQIKAIQEKYGKAIVDDLIKDDAQGVKSIYAPVDKKAEEARKKQAAIFSSIYLLLFLVALHIGYFYLMWPLFLVSPLISLYMFYSVIYEGPEKN